MGSELTKSVLSPEISNIERSEWLHWLSEAAAAAKRAAAANPRSPSSKLLSMLIGDKPEMLEDAAYGFPPTQGTGMTLAPKPEYASDVADLIPVSPIAKGVLSGSAKTLLASALLGVKPAGKATSELLKKAAPRKPKIPEEIVEAAKEKTLALTEQPYPQFPVSPEYEPWKVRSGGFEPKFDAAKKKWYVGKVTSSAEDALQKRVAEAEAWVDAGNATPMWDFENLYRPPQQNVRLDYKTRPKGIPDWIAEQYGDDYRKAMTDAALKPGSPNAWKFYWTGPVHDDFVQQLGKSEGPRAFQQYATNLGATTSGARPFQNARFASYHDVMQEQGLPVPVAVPYPYGHNRWALHRQALEGRGSNLLLPPQINPKGSTFAGDVSGLTPYSTFDEVMTGEKGQKLHNQQGKIENAPFEGTYGFAIDQFNPILQPIGRSSAVPKEVRQGLQQSDAQSKIWAELGGDPSYAVTLPEHISNRINVTARVTGLSPEEVKRRWIAKRMPLLGVGGGSVLLGGGVPDFDEGVQ